MPQNNRPRETDLLARHSEQINRNERAINNIEQRDGASAWVPITPLNSWAVIGTPFAIPAYRRVGDTVEFRGHLNGTAATSNTVAFQILQPFRPKYDVSYLTDIQVTAGGSFISGRIYISATTGNVTIIWPSS